MLIVDEAYLLDPAQLEELRLMTHADMDSASPFAGILVGQPTLARQLRIGTFAALDQRIAARLAIKPMDLAESVARLLSVGQDRARRLVIMLSVDRGPLPIWGRPRNERMLDRYITGWEKRDSEAEISQQLR